jgi:hypothetical protein
MGKFLHWYQVNFIRLYQREKEKEREREREREKGGRKEGVKEWKGTPPPTRLIMQL